MTNVDALLKRIDAEFESARKKVRQFQEEKLAEYHERQQRLEVFSSICDQLRDEWKPRLEALAQRLGERASVRPLVTPALREATFRFQSQLAKITLTFSAMTDTDVRKLILRYDLEILPILMRFKNADRLEMPLDQVDRQAVGIWIDDRILEFVQTYLDLHANEQYLNYLKHYMVEDPVAGVRFPQYAAAAQCEWNGKTHYFIGDETLQEFKRQHGIAD